MLSKITLITLSVKRLLLFFSKKCLQYSLVKTKKSEMIGLRVEPEIKAIIEQEAARQDRTVAWITAYYLRKGLEAAQLLLPKEDA
jgi:uncharacterized protein (DUF1778 family)